MTDQELEQLAESKIGHNSEGMWITTDGRPHHSRRWAIAEQILIEKSNLMFKGMDDEQ